ncbi:hypothetical protein G7046_g1912 [Stylonectria norvegica]|nr:hypothetical protein G7046_g1912 [Stylonectria norvegica]
MSDPEVTVPVPRVNVSQLFNAIHDICISAAQHYIMSLQDNPPVQGRHVERHANNPSSAGHAGGDGLCSAFERLFLQAEATESLKDSVNTICDIIWERGRALRLSYPDTAVDMARHIANIIRTSNAFLKEVAKGEERSCGENWVAVHAARDFCGHLNDWEKRERIAVLVYNATQCYDVWRYQGEEEL